MRIGLLSDTHGFLDDAVFRHFAECDEIWYAGDFGTVEVLDGLRAFRPVRGVYGNVDGAELRADLSEDLGRGREGVTVYMTHTGGYPGNYDRRAVKEIHRLAPGLFICGHSHILKVIRDPALQLLHMNLGACGHNG
jgi:predicted phosphodiesterase